MAIPQTSRFVTSEINNIFIDSIRDLRTDLGKTIDLKFSALSTYCGNCEFDPENNISSNVYSPDSPYPTGLMPGPISFIGGLCPVCSGVGYVESASSASTSGVQVLLKRLKDKDREYTIAGKREYLDWRVKADITEYLPFLTCDYINMLDDTDADGNAMKAEVVSMRKKGLKTDALVEVFLKKSDNANLDHPTPKLT